MPLDRLVLAPELCDIDPLENVPYTEKLPDDEPLGDDALKDEPMEDEATELEDSLELVLIRLELLGFVIE